MAIMASIGSRMVALLLGVGLLQVTSLTLALAHSAPAPSWRPLAALPAPTAGLAATRLPDGSVLAVGGDASTGTNTELAARFSLQSGSWHRLPNAPVPLATPAVLALNMHAVLVVAPSIANGTMAAPSKALILDPLRGQWLSLPSCPVALFQPRLLQLNAHEVLAVGGIGDTIGAIFDRSTQRWTPLASPVAALSTYTLAALPDGRAMLVASVAIDAQHQPAMVRQAFALTAAHTWQTLARPPIAVDGEQAVALDDHRILLAGGYGLADDPSAPVPPALIYDVHLDRWSVAGATGADHRGAQLVALAGGRALLIGGHGPDGQPSAGCLLFDGSRWQAAQPLPGPWAGYALVTLADGSVLLIGGDRPSSDGFTTVADTMLLPLGTPQG
ncbi:MAG TPA: hypothetical protein VHB98_24345 [Chloroflexota bacterium]|nr:hypothetical protein [Chloroflexota bacterium]